MNKIFISGNLGKDCELSFAAGTGKAILKFSVGVARGFKKEDGTDWVNCTLFGERAEKLAQYLTKGTKVIVEGALRLGSYEGKDGIKKYTTEVFVNNVEMIGGKKEGTSNAEAQQEVLEGKNGFEEVPVIDDGDIPF